MASSLSFSPGSRNVSSPLAAEVLVEAESVHGLTCLRVASVPAQDMVAGATEEDVAQKLGQVALSVLDQPEELAQVWRVYRQVGRVVLVEQFELVVYVPRALVPRRGREETALLPRAQELFQQPVTPNGPVPEVVALVYEHEVPITVAHVIQKRARRLHGACSSRAHGS